jgi:hypothetical protein
LKQTNGSVLVSVRLKSDRAVRRFYEGLYTDDERAQLGDALRSADLASEVELLRILIERAVLSKESNDVVSQMIGRLSQVLRVQHQLSGDSARSLDEALARVLAEVGSELGL